MLRNNKITEDEIKIQAYRDFADRLRTRKRVVRALDFCAEFWDYAVLVEDIDNLLKGMVGEEE